MESNDLSVIDAWRVGIHFQGSLYPMEINDNHIMKYIIKQMKLFVVAVRVITQFFGTSLCSPLAGPPSSSSFQGPPWISASHSMSHILSFIIPIVPEQISNTPISIMVQSKNGWYSTVNIKHGKLY